MQILLLNLNQSLSSPLLLLQADLSSPQLLLQANLRLNPPYSHLRLLPRHLNQPSAILTQCANNMKILSFSKNASNSMSIRMSQLIKGDLHQSLLHRNNPLVVQSHLLEAHNNLHLADPSYPRHRLEASLLLVDPSHPHHRLEASLPLVEVLSNLLLVVQSPLLEAHNSLHLADPSHLRHLLEAHNNLHLVDPSHLLEDHNNLHLVDPSHPCKLLEASLPLVEAHSNLLLVDLSPLVEAHKLPLHQKLLAHRYQPLLRTPSLNHHLVQALSQIPRLLRKKILMLLAKIT